MSFTKYIYWKYIYHLFAFLSIHFFCKSYCKQNNQYTNLYSRKLLPSFHNFALTQQICYMENVTCKRWKKFCCNFFFLLCVFRFCSSYSLCCCRTLKLCHYIFIFLNKHYIQIVQTRKIWFYLVKDNTVCVLMYKRYFIVLFLGDLDASIATLREFMKCLKNVENVECYLGNTTKVIQ